MFNNIMDITPIYAKIDSNVKTKAMFYAQKCFLAKMGRDQTMSDLIENALIYYMDNHTLDNDLRVKEIMKNISDGNVTQE